MTGSKLLRKFILLCFLVTHGVVPPGFMLAGGDGELVGLCHGDQHSQEMMAMAQMQTELAIFSLQEEETDNENTDRNEKRHKMQSCLQAASCDFIEFSRFENNLGAIKDETSTNSIQSLYVGQLATTYLARAPPTKV